MSTAPQHRSVAGHSGMRMTAEQFLALGETEARLELLDGVVCVSPSPLPPHQRVLDEIQFQFGLLRRAGLRIVVFPDTDVRFDVGIVYRPDLSVYTAARMPAIPERLTTPPDLCVEVLSPGSKMMDLITKRDDYDRFGVGEYWTLDPDDGRFRAWVRRGNHMIEAPVEGESVECAAIPGLRLDLPAARAAAGR